MALDCTAQLMLTTALSTHASRVPRGGRLDRRRPDRLLQVRDRRQEDDLAGRPELLRDRGGLPGRADEAGAGAFPGEPGGLGGGGSELGGRPAVP